MFTVWWFRPANNAARVGEHSAVVWNRVYFKPCAATASATGVRHGPPNADDDPNPASSINTTNTFGAPLADAADGSAPPSPADPWRRTPSDAAARCPPPATR